MTKTKRTTKLADVTHSLWLLGEVLAEAAAVRSAIFLEKLGILAPPAKSRPNPRSRRPSSGAARGGAS